VALPSCRRARLGGRASTSARTAARSPAANSRRRASSKAAAVAEEDFDVGLIGTGQGLVLRRARDLDQG
jgi:hypothetical protein